MQRDPFFWMINGNININLWNVVDIPISATYSKEDKNFNYPEYKQFGISPKYKDLTVHLGYRNLQLSTYSLSGVTFLGGGIEYKHQNSGLHATALYGRFNKAVSYRDVDKFQTMPEQYTQQPMYERWGYGGKIGYTKKQNSINLLLFRAKDDPSSLNYLPNDDEIIYPKENLIIGIITKNAITKRLSVGVEYNLSAYSSNINQNEVTLSSYKYANYLGDLYSPRMSSSFKGALISNLNYKYNRHNVGIAYKRIEPDYQSLGAPYLLSDIEQITINVATGLKENKVRVSGNIGTQHNNLDNSLSTTMNRFIGAANITYNISNEFNTTISLSNYSSNTVPTRVDVLDSIKYVQVTQNYAINTNYSKKDEVRSHRLSTNINYQTADTENTSEQGTFNTHTNVINGVASYSLALIPNSISFVLSISGSQFDNKDFVTNSIGPTLGASKDFYDRKLKLSFSATYINSYDKSELQNNMITTGITASYKINKHNTLRVGGRYLQRTPAEGSITKQTQANFTYRYTF